VVTTSASSATMNEAVEVSARTHFLAVSCCDLFIVQPSLAARCREVRARSKDDWQALKDALKIFCSALNFLTVSKRLQMTPCSVMGLDGGTMENSGWIRNSA
jgi:hypothetical protein